MTPKPFIWHPASERPETSSKSVWILTRHWKGRLPTSYEILAGEVRFSGQKGPWCVTNYDDTGGGCPSWYPEGQEIGGANYDYEDFVAWAYYEEGQLPEFLPPAPR